MFAQHYLQAHAEHRVRVANAGLRHAREQVRAYDSVNWTHPGARAPAEPTAASVPAPVPDRTSVTVVLRRFELTTYLESVLRYTLSLPDTLGEPWLRAYSRTIFLSGNPDNLRTRFPFHHISADGAMAWTKPADTGEAPPLRRLLRLFPTAGLPALPAGAEIPAPAAPARPAEEAAPVRTARLDVVTTRVSLADYLVHVHHMLAEAVLSHLIDQSTSVTVRHVPQLDPAEGPYHMLRVLPDRDAADGRLRAYAGVTART
ncbi:DUF6182 family protein [Streptomyces sp. NPDC052236]|uniref:DUF6182 family protein n=1 Tax=Streptomyces sp. NPDC052236 TaxID=3365686 RepID=UPI0037CD30DC